MKIVMVVNKTLPPGLAANAAAVLGISLGSMDADILGPDLIDKSGTLHPGITRETIPVLASDSDGLKAIYEQGIQIPDIAIIDFNSIAQKSRHYEDYSRQLETVPTADLGFSGLCIKGPGKKVNRLTGSLGLYR
ncbi:MAG: DUF2000 domain-containing protein [Desulfobacterales bacterium]|nr:DUF2000 domain-containing protein [Desulfobacterales bacterium]